MRNVTKTDDKQLWRICDVIDGQDCSWPIYATPCVDSQDHPAMLVELAYPLTSVSQQQFVHVRLKQAAFEQDGSKWLLRPRSLEQVAFKCSGVTPKFYLKWPGEFTGGTVTEVKEKPLYKDDVCADEDFVRYVANQIGNLDIAHLRLVFNAFCWNALRYMLNEYRPIDFGFATIHALPYRKNWAPILHARYPGIASVFERSPEECRATLDALGFDLPLFSSDMMSMPTNNTFGWTLEIIPKEKTRKEFQKVEDEAAEQYAQTNVSYLWRWSKIVKAKLEEITHVFEDWIEAASLPVATVDSSRPSDQWLLSPKRTRGRVRPIVPPPPPTYYRTASHSADGWPVTHPILDEKAVAGVQELPDDDTFKLGIGLRKRGRVANRDTGTDPGPQI